MSVARSFFFVLLFSMSIKVWAQDAQVQFINNCADQIAATADIWINDQQLDNIDFRTASGFVAVPGGQEMRIGMAPGSSTSSSESHSWWPVTFDAGQRYLIIFNGVRNPGDYLPNPAGHPIELTIQQVAGVPSTAAPGKVSVLFSHGITDAPNLDITSGATTAAHALAYGTSTEFNTVSADNYTFIIAPTGGQPLLAYSANLAPYAEQSITIVASGFLVPVANQNGSALGLFIVTSQGGPFLPLKPTTIPTTASIQFIHNAADPALSAVDVYVGTEKVADDFAFRTATPFIQLPVAQPIQLGIAPASSTDASGVVFTHSVSLEPGRCALVLNGVLDTTSFEQNPNEPPASTALDFFLLSNIQPAAVNPTGLDILYMNGCTDCPALDIVHAGTKVVSGLSYGNHADYVSLEAGNTPIQVRSSNAEQLLSLSADVSALAGQAAIVVVSGFLSPTKNMNGAELGLWVAKQLGGPLQEISTVTSVTQTHGSSFSAYPNPSSSTVYIVGYSPSASKIAITDISGRVVQSTDITSAQTTLDVSNLATGIYTIIIYGDGDYQSSSTLVRMP